jgi:hypothetical protein
MKGELVNMLVIRYLGITLAHVSVELRSPNIGKEVHLTTIYILPTTLRCRSEACAVAFICIICRLGRDFDAYDQGSTGHLCRFTTSAPGSLPRVSRHGRRIDIHHAGV